MARERRRFEIEDRMEEVYTGSGGRQSLSMPSGLQLFKPPKSGTFRLEVIPFLVGDAVKRFSPTLRFTNPGKWHWTVIYHTHGGVGADQGTVVCPGRTYSKACPICEQRQKLSQSAHIDDKKAAKALSPKERQLLLVSVRDPMTASLGPVLLWEISTFCFKKQLDLFLAAADPEDHETYARFWHPEKGLTLKVTGSEEKTGDGGSTYGKYSVMEMKPRKEPLPDEIFDHGYDLHAMVREQSYTVLRNLFHGAEEDVPDPVDPDGGDGVPFSVSRSRQAPPDGDDDTITSGTSELSDEPKRGIPDDFFDAKPTPPKPPATPELAVGMTVVFDRAGQPVTGQIVAVDHDRRIVQVPVAGRERPLTLDFEEVTVTTAAPAAPARKAADPTQEKARVAPPPPADDDDDLPPPPTKKRVAGK